MAELERRTEEKKALTIELKKEFDRVNFSFRKKIDFFIYFNLRLNLVLLNYYLVLNY